MRNKEGGIIYSPSAKQGIAPIHLCPKGIQIWIKNKIILVQCYDLNENIVIIEKKGIVDYLLNRLKPFDKLEKML